MIIKKSNKKNIIKIILVIIFAMAVITAIKSYRNIEKTKLQEVIYINQDIEKGTKLNDIEVNIVKIKEVNSINITEKEYSKMINDNTSKYIINHNMIKNESLSITDISKTESVYSEGSVLYVIPTKSINISQAVRPQDLLMLIIKEKQKETTELNNVVVNQNINEIKRSKEELQNQSIEKIVTVEYIKNTKGQKIYDVRKIKGKFEEIKVKFRENNSDNIGLVEVSSNIESAKIITDAISSEEYIITTLVIPYGSEEYGRIKKEKNNEDNK